MNFIKHFFKIEENNTTIKTEIIAGVTTFMTMAYIIFVNPIILSNAKGMEKFFPALIAATCIASAVSTLFMGIIAKYPIALAPGMGLNAFFAFGLCSIKGVTWEIALGMVFLSGVFFTILSLVKIRQMIIDSIPTNLKLAIPVGIGIFIAFIGLKEAGIVINHDATFVTIGKLTAKPTLVAIFGILFSATLLALKVKGAILLGILVTGCVGYFTGIVQAGSGIVSTPVIAPIFAKLDIMGALKVSFIAPILCLVFFDMFDSIGTIVGVTEKANLLKDGELERATPALLSDSLGTMFGAVCGTSTVTSYIESSSGVSEGGKTGLTSVVTGLLFLVAMFFTPIAQMLGGAYKFTYMAAGKTVVTYLHPVTAPALILVGFMMIEFVGKIEWNDFTEGFPAFLTIIVMPLTFSIAHGLAIGFIVYAVLKIVSGKVKEASIFVYILAFIFLLGYTFLGIT